MTRVRGRPPEWPRLESPVKTAGSQSAAGGKRARTKSRNREIILEAARAVFAGIGFGAATVRDIIRATPLASGTFYNYFKSKEEVYEAIRDDAALAVRPHLRAARRQAATAEEFLAATFRMFFEFAAREKAYAGAPRPETTRLRMDTREVIAGFEELREDVETAIAGGLFPPVDADLLMAAIVGVAFEIAGRMLARQAAGEPLDPAEAASFAAALFLGGLQALPRKPAAPQVPAP